MLIRFPLLLIITAGIALLNSCSTRADEPTCYYIPSERVLYIDDSHFKLIAMKINVYEKPEMDGNFERIELRFKESVSLQSIDFDQIDSSKIENYNEIDIRKIEKASSIGIPFIYINSIYNKTAIDDIRSLNNIDLSKPYTICKRVMI